MSEETIIMWNQPMTEAHVKVMIESKPNPVDTGHTALLNDVFPISHIPADRYSAEHWNAISDHLPYSNLPTDPDYDISELALDDLAEVIKVLDPATYTAEQLDFVLDNLTSSTYKKFIETLKKYPKEEYTLKQQVYLTRLVDFDVSLYPVSEGYDVHHWIVLAAIPPSELTDRWGITMPLSKYTVDHCTTLFNTLASDVESFDFSLFPHDNFSGEHWNVIFREYQQRKAQGMLPTDIVDDLRYLTSQIPPNETTAEDYLYLLQLSPGEIAEIQEVSGIHPSELSKDAIEFIRNKPHLLKVETIRNNITTVDIGALEYALNRGVPISHFPIEVFDPAEYRSVAGIIAHGLWDWYKEQWYIPADDSAGESIAAVEEAIAGKSKDQIEAIIEKLKSMGARYRALHDAN